MVINHKEQGEDRNPEQRSYPTLGVTLAPGTFVNGEEITELSFWLSHKVKETKLESRICQEWEL